MGIDAIVRARSEFYARASNLLFSPVYAKYAQGHALDIERITYFAGATSVLEIVDCGNGRFDFAGNGEPIEAFVIDVIDADGETHIDIAAWPVDNPGHVLTMFGRAPLMGMWAALNPASYYMGKPLIMHRTPLEWLMSGCSGAAVLVPDLAARLLIDLPGPIAARDHQHRLQLQKLMHSVVDADSVIVSGAGEWAA